MVKKIFFLMILVIICSSFVSSQETDPCLDLSLTFDQTTEQIDLAIACDKEISNEEFKLASQNMKEKYVLGSYANFTFEEQTNVFRKIALEDEFDYENNITSLKKFFKEINFTDDDEEIFERTVIVNISIINEEIVIFKKYAEQKGVSFIMLSGTFANYSNKTDTFLTKGTHSTTLDLDYLRFYSQRWGAKYSLMSDGKIIIAEYGEEFDCSLCVAEVDRAGYSISIKKGEINLQNVKYSSADNNMIIDKKGDNYILQGDIIVKQDGKVIATFDGQAQLIEENHIKLGKDTTLTQYSDGKEIFDYASDDESEYFYELDSKLTVNSECFDDVCYEYNDYKSIKNPCDAFEDTCAYYDDKNSYFYTKIHKDKATFFDSGEAVEKIDVNIISENSQFIYSNPKGTNLLYKDGEIFQKGNLADLNPLIDMKDSEHEYKISNTEIARCSECEILVSVEEQDSSSITDKRFSVTGIFQIPLNSDNTVSAGIDGFLVERSIRSQIDRSEYLFDSALLSCDISSAKKCDLSNQKITSFQKQPYNVLVITGHHKLGQFYFYGDRDFDSNGVSSPNEIALLFLPPKWSETVEKNKEYYFMPKNNNVEIILFSACSTVPSKYWLETKNTVKDPRDNSVVTINDYLNYYTERFPNLKLIVGYHGTAPGIDRNFNKDNFLNFNILESNGIKAYADNILKQKSSYSHGVSYYYRGDDGRWIFNRNMGTTYATEIIS